MLLEFNNNNIWEVTEFNDEAGKYIVCLNRKGRHDKVQRINENLLTPEGIFPYNEWKDFFVNPKLSSERLDEPDFPMVYYAIYVLGYPKPEKIYPTKYVFHLI